MLCLTACIVFNRLRTENEFTFGSEGVALDAVKLHKWLRRFLSEYETLFQALSPSRLCKNGFICGENLRDVRNPLVAHQLLDIISVIQTGTIHDITRFARFSHAGRRRFVQVLQHTWPASRRLARTVLATL